MKKLNFGCGDRYSSQWINIDFHSQDKNVIKYNLLKPLPFPDNSLDVVYSSHVIEHFSKEEGERIIEECFRILKPHGILRIVVPDLEQTCSEYLRIMEMTDIEEAKNQYEWIVIELLDQMVRTKSGGLMRSYWRHILENNDEPSINYVEARIGVKVKQEVLDLNHRSFAQKLLDINPNKLKNKLIYLYVDMVKSFIPRNIRQAMMDSTPLGEKHKWMYDRYSLKTLIEKKRFTEIRFLDAYTSSIPNLSDELLDLNPDGTPYKPGSLYCEGMKPKE
ncbi:MAG: methyltransferase domain-containing protein [Brasilonema octagenarum HA4186-MV1]|jgi:predicted SAM-dependent methyltransferase|nr:methyltransferase domain-containing protein [Brasilonema octagenarum HA4186-MV1]